MHPRARERSRRAQLDVELVGLSADQFPYEDGSFDTVAVAFALCIIADLRAALREMRRVLRPGGTLIFYEHGLAPEASVQRWQHRLTPVWPKLAGGCHLDRDISALLRDAGFRSRDRRCGYLPGPRLLTYNFWGTATAAPEADAGSP
jgi:ubiquinone/menaquinone biosynthesis C-methylase UbiE